MSKYFILATLAMAGALTLNAGQIQLSGSGPVNNNVSGFGLTGSVVNGVPGQYIQPTSSCAGSQLNGSPCAAAQQTTTGGATGTFQGNYGVMLFAGATGLSQPIPDAAMNTPNNTGKLNSSFVGSDGLPVQFDLMNSPNGSSGYTGNATCTLCIDGNYWQSGGATNKFIVPVGLINVDSVYTMLNDYWGTPGAHNITVSFCFTATSNGTCDSASLLNVVLTNGEEVRASIICDPGQCPTTDASNIATTLVANNVNVGGSGVNVNTGTVYSSRYTAIPTLNPTGAPNRKPWAGSAGGSVVLDNQQFVFSTSVYSDKYLSYIQFVDTGIGWSSTTGLNNVSRYALSAITVDQTPEPASVFMIIAGLGAVGFGRLRRRA